jgi:hypothetical protein
MREKNTLLRKNPYNVSVHLTGLINLSLSPSKLKKKNKNTKIKINWNIHSRQ